MVWQMHACATRNPFEVRCVKSPVTALRPQQDLNRRYLELRHPLGIALLNSHGCVDFVITFGTWEKSFFEQGLRGYRDFDGINLYASKDSEAARLDKSASMRTSEPNSRRNRLTR